MTTTIGTVTTETGPVATTFIRPPRPARRSCPATSAGSHHPPIRRAPRTIARSCPVASAGPHRPVRRAPRDARPNDARPNYVLRRVAVGVIATAIVALAAALAVTVLAGVGGSPAAASVAQPAPSAPAVYVVADGDTLWSIASAHRGSVDQGRYVDALIELNGGSGIQPGEAIRLP